MTGNDTGETYRLGDPVRVKLVEAAPVAGALRFELVSQGRFDAPKRRAHHDERRDQGRRGRDDERGPRKQKKRRRA
jgi:ribonuclease R